MASGEPLKPVDLLYYVRHLRSFTVGWWLERHRVRTGTRASFSPSVLPPPPMTAMPRLRPACHARRAKLPVEPGYGR